MKDETSLGASNKLRLLPPRVVLIFHSERTSSKVKSLQRLETRSERLKQHNVGRLFSRVIIQINWWPPSVCVRARDAGHFVALTRGQK